MKPSEALEKLILVTVDDKEIGSLGKEEVHREGLLHRAFSVFLYDGERMLLQKRADGKYHSGGLWTNACCSHPRVGEALEDAVHRRLMLECGLDTEVRELFSFTYRTKFADDLYEYEYDHVFLGTYDSSLPIRMDPEEASEYRWVGLSELKQELLLKPDTFTSWFLIAISKVLPVIEQENALKYQEAQEKQRVGETTPEKEA